MTNIIIILIYINFIHFFADYVFQPYSMQVDKSKKLSALFEHVFIYSSMLFVSLVIFNKIYFSEYKLILTMKYCGLNFIFHFIIDLISAKFIKNLGNKIMIDRDDKKFIIERVDLWGPICLLGLDQFFHLSLLTASVIILL